MTHRENSLVALIHNKYRTIKGEGLEDYEMSSITSELYQQSQVAFDHFGSQCRFG